MSAARGGERSGGQSEKAGRETEAVSAKGGAAANGKKCGVKASGVKGEARRAGAVVSAGAAGTGRTSHEQACGTAAAAAAKEAVLVLAL